MKRGSEMAVSKHRSLRQRLRFLLGTTLVAGCLLGVLACATFLGVLVPADFTLVDENTPRGAAVPTAQISLKEQEIIAQKEALVEEYMRVTPGTASEEIYRKHLDDFLLQVGEDPSRDPFPPPPVPTDGPTLIPPTPTPALAAVDMATAWGPDVKVSSVPAALDPGHLFLPDTATSDAGFLLGTVYPRKLGTEAGRLVLLDVKTRQAINIRVLPKPMVRVLSADVDHDWIVWLEADFADWETYGWEIYSYRRDSGQIRKVSGEPAQPTCSGCGTEIAISQVDRDTLFWTRTVFGSRPPSSYVTVYSTNLVTKVTEIIEGVTNYPAISWPYLAWVQSEYSLEKRSAGIREDSWLKLLNFETKDVRTLGSLQNPWLASVHGDSIVWTNSNGETVLSDLAERTARVIVSRPEVGLLGLRSLNERVVALSSYPDPGLPIFGNELLVWDRVQQRLVRVADGGFLARVNGDALIWVQGQSPRAFIENASEYEGEDVLTLPASQTIHILNTSQLP